MPLSRLKKTRKITVFWSGHLLKMRKYWWQKYREAVIVGIKPTLTSIHSRIFLVPALEITLRGFSCVASIQQGSSAK